MKVLSLVFFLFLSLGAFAHDEGHGPALTDETQQGGKVSAIIDADDIKKGREAKMLYKGELVHSSRNMKVKLYLYDSEMKPVDLASFGKKVEAIQLERGNNSKFELSLDESGKFFVGMRPKNKRVPFNIDLRLSKGDQKLFGAFDGLD